MLCNARKIRWHWHGIYQYTFLSTGSITQDVIESRPGYPYDKDSSITAEMKLGIES